MSWTGRIAWIVAVAVIAGVIYMNFDDWGLSLPELGSHEESALPATANEKEEDTTAVRPQTGEREEASIEPLVAANPPRVAPEELEGVEAPEEAQHRTETIETRVEDFGGAMPGAEARAARPTNPTHFVVPGCSALIIRLYETHLSQEERMRIAVGIRNRLCVDGDVMRGVTEGIRWEAFRG